MTSEEALTYSAIKLFTLRASETLDGYRLTDADVAAVADICRRLEGNALAIELAASRIDALLPQELAIHLDDRFLLLKRGRKSAVARHRTLDAALDWSYELLSNDERELLQMLSIFAGVFTLDAATGLCGQQVADTLTVIDSLANLVRKSLVSADTSGAHVRYRLMDTTKASMREKVEQSGQLSSLQRRHAEFHCSLLSGSRAELEVLAKAAWLAKYSCTLEDIRKALAWAHSTDGDLEIAISLTVAAVPLWLTLLLPEECNRYVLLALTHCNTATLHSKRNTMILHAANGIATLYASGPMRATYDAWASASELATELNDGKYQQLALWGMAVYHSYSGQADAVSELSERLCRIAIGNGDHSAIVSMKRLLGTALHYTGEQAAAREQLESMLAQYAPPQGHSIMARLQLNQRSAALTTLATVLWLQGYPERAVRMSEEGLREARESANAESLLNAIATAAFPLALNLGDYDTAEALLRELSCHLSKHSQTLWETLRSCLESTLFALRGDVLGPPQLHHAIVKLQAAGYCLHLTSHLGRLASILRKMDQYDAGKIVIDNALKICESGREKWNYAELLRIKGELAEMRNPGLSEQLYRKALGIAINQGTPSWELRAANNLAKLKALQCDRADSVTVLRDAYRKFSEGFETVDLRMARSILDSAG
jgi:predicted ATPase